MSWSPVVDGEFIPDNPEVLLESGAVNQKDIIIGINQDEGSMFAGISAGVQAH